MQPERFATSLLGWICADGVGRARSFADAGYTGSPYGVHLALPSGAQVFLQTVGAAPEGVGGNADTDAPVWGAPPPPWPPVSLPGQGATDLNDVERWLAWRITVAQGERSEVAAVSLFQERTGRSAIPHGLALAFHSGARGWLYFRHVTAAGREAAGGPVWRALPSV